MVKLINIGLDMEKAVLATDKAVNVSMLLREFIVANGISDQERLPPERDLALRLGVTRGQLRLGLDQLENEGMLWRHVGRGTFYGPRPKKPLNVSTVADLTNPREIMEARIIIEPELARLASHRASTIELSRMHDYIKLSSQSVDLLSFLDNDNKLHLTIAQAAGNNLLLALYQSIHANRHGAIWGKLREQLLTKKQMKLYLRQHRDIVNALTERNSANSYKLMKRHLISVENNLFQDYPVQHSDNAP